MVDLVGNDEAIFSIKNFKGAIKANYMFVTDPPLMADIGSINFNSDNCTFNIYGYTAFKDNDFELIIKDINLMMEPFILHFDGISDTSDVVSRFLTFSGNIIRDRLVSISQYDRALPKLNAILNAVIEIIPDEIHIPTTDLYLEGGISKNFKIKKNTYIEIPTDISLQNTKYPYLQPNLAVFDDFVQEDYDMQIYLSDFLLESGMHAMYHAGLLQLNNLHVPISTTELDIALFGQMSRNGFGHGNNCSVDIRVIGDPPELVISKDKGL